MNKAKCHSGMLPASAQVIHFIYSQGTEWGWERGPGIGTNEEVRTRMKTWEVRRRRSSFSRIGHCGEVACGVYTASVSFSVLVRGGEGGMGNTLPPCHVRGRSRD